jgi:hypothetical protein
MMQHVARVLGATFVMLFVGSDAYAICDNLTASQRYDRAAVVADVVVESIEREAQGPYQDQRIAVVRVVSSAKGAQPGARLKVSSNYNQAEMIRFPAPGSAFHLLAVGGLEIFRTNECLYFQVSPAFSELMRPPFLGLMGR